MELTTMSELLKADEERLRRSLRADAELTGSSSACADTLREELTGLLLRHNAACASDRLRQANADAMTAAVRESIGLLDACRAEKTAATRQITGRALALLLCALVLCTAAVFLAAKALLASYVCVVLALVSAFLAGRFWMREQEGELRTVAEPDAVWKCFQRSVETMDRKLGETGALLRELESRPAVADSGGDAGLSQEDIRLCGDLLEALYARNGDFALRQLSRLPDWLEGKGVELVDCAPETEELFKRFPTRRDSATQRPALRSGGKLLLMGKATEHIG